MTAVRAHHNQVDRLAFSNAMYFSLRPAEDEVLPVRLNGQRTSEVCQLGSGLFMDLVLDRRQVHGNIATIGQAEWLDDVNDAQLGLKDLSQGNGLLRYLCRFLGQVDRKEQVSISGHAWPPSTPEGDSGWNITQTPQSAQQTVTHMNTTTLIIIGVTLLFFLGPLLWLRPTPRDKQLERLRARARSLGMHVSVKEIPDPDPHYSQRVTSGGKVLDPKREVAIYRLPINLPADLDAAHVPVWEVVRMREDSEGREKEDAFNPGLRPGWRLSVPGLPLYPEVLRSLSALLEQAPRGTVGIDANARSTGLFWRERGDEQEVERIHGLLLELRRWQLELAREVAREAVRLQSLDEDELRH